MTRPSRNKKQVNYSEFQDQDDEEDFTGPPSKKTRVLSSEPEKERKDASKSVIEEKESQQGLSPKARLSVEEKLFERSLEAAIQLSMIQATEGSEDLSSRDKCDQNEHPADAEKKDYSPLLSNCSVDTSLLGLDEITDEPVTHSTPSRQRQAAARAQEQQKCILNKETESGEDDDYKPTNRTNNDSGSDKDFSENDDSDDEEFTVKKSTKKKASKKEPVRHLPASKKEKKPSKAVKSKSKAPETPAVSRSAGPASKKPLSAPTTVRPAVPISPAGGRLPKWNPPALVGQSPNTRTPQVKSPGQGLRLGLSRLARVKPLHPSMAH